MFHTSAINWAQVTRKVCCCLVTKSCPTLLQSHGLQPARLLSLWDFPEKNIGVGCHLLLQGIFSTQGSGLPFAFPGDILNPGIKAMSPALAGRFFTIEPLGKSSGRLYFYVYLKLLKIFKLLKNKSKHYA